MPVYVYECEVCGERFELQRHFGDPHPTTCPHGHKGLHRVFSPPAVIFKGSGFYVTDHARTNGQASRREKTEKETSKPEKTQSKAKEGDDT
jgi:putative FmdB family regulatory protein